jgi:A/G-specific adenine glycosylase
MDFANELIQWYEANKRGLPWRGINDAYVIWLSEIILQQTRVEQGMPYFYRFLEKYPDVNSFAAAEEDEILKLWQGLGYYSRGRNMLKTARLVSAQYNGVFPRRYDELIKLKGIGEYTAAAIASFSANEAKAVVDGNVYRLLARYFGISEPINSPQGKKIFQQTANEVLNHDHAGLHNQAIMEFGALLCKPKNPACGICPVRTNCYAFNNNAIAGLPVKLNKLKIRERFFNYLLIIKDEEILLNKRAEKDIWANMYDLPLIETAEMVPVNELISMPGVSALFGENTEILEVSQVYRHVLTHQRLYVRFIKLKTNEVKLEQKWFFTKIENLKNFALPKIIFIFLKNIFNL